MGNFNRDDRSSGGFRGGFSRGGDRGRGGFSRGRSSFGGDRGGFGRGGDRGPREMFKTVCSNCGKECEVPFRPTNGKPVYCSDCFEKMGNGGRSEGRHEERQSFRPQAQVSVPSNSQLEALNAKLDKIISLLEAKNVDAVMPKMVVEDKTPKVRKVVKKAPIKK